MAAQEGHADVVALLLEQKDMSILDAKDDRGRTPLMYAAAANQTACVALLLDEGANPNHVDIKEISVAHCLASVGDVEGLKMLKDKGGSLSMASKSGTFPLHEAALAGKNDAMDYLVAQGVPVDVIDASGITPLHCSIANDNADSCKILLEKGANVNPVMRTKDMRFLTPLDYALINVRPNCAEFLASKNGLPGIIYTGILANRIRLAWRRFRRRKYGRSRPASPVRTPVPVEEPPAAAVSRDEEEMENIQTAMEVNNDLEDFLNQEARGMKISGRGHRVTADNFKSYRQARTYNTSVVQEKESDKMYFKRTIDKSVRSSSQTSLDGKDYLFTANRRLQTYEEWMMLKWQEMKEKSVHNVRWTPVKIEPPKNVDITQPPPAKDVKILYREYSSKTGRINKVVATNPDGARIEFRSDPPSDGEGKPARKKSPYKSRPRIIDPETAAAYKLPSYNFGGYNGEPSSYNRKPLHFEHPNTTQKGKKVSA